MATTLKDLYESAMSLDDEERAELIGMLLESLEIEDDEGVASEWLKEIERRLTELDTGSRRTVPWSKVRSKLFDPGVF